MKIPIVNEQDNIIGHKERGEITGKDIRRITHVWVFNKNKDFLIAKRQPTKVISPNKWGPAVTGTLEKGDTYESNAIKEAEEEIGLHGVPIVPLKKIYYENHNGKRFCYIYTVSVDMPENEFSLQENEVAKVKWVSLDELSNLYQKSPDSFIPSMGHTIGMIRKYQNENQD